MAEYPEQRADGSVWVVEYDPETDAILGERMVSGPTGGGGGVPINPQTAVLNNWMSSQAQQQAYQQAMSAADDAYRQAALQGQNEASARNAAIQAGSNALSGYISLLNAYGGGAGLDPNAIAAFIRGEGDLTLPSGPTLEGRKTIAELQANPRDIFKLAAYQAGLGGATGAYSGFGANANEQQALEGFPGMNTTPGGGGPGMPGGTGAVPGGGLGPGAGGTHFVDFQRSGPSLGGENETLYGKMSNGQWVTFSSPEDLQAALTQTGQGNFMGPGGFDWGRFWHKVRPGLGPTQGYDPQKYIEEGNITSIGGGPAAGGYNLWAPKTGATPWQQGITTPGAPASPGAGGGIMYPGGSPIDPSTGLRWDDPSRMTREQLGGMRGTLPTSAPLPPGEGVMHMFGTTPSNYNPSLYNLPQFQQLREQYGAASPSSFPFAPQVPLPQPNAIPLNYMSQQSPFNRSLLEAAYSTAGLSKDVYQEPFRVAERAFGGGGGLGY